MAKKSGEEPDRTRYLMGELPEPERERLEMRFFTDDEAFEQMLIAEDELIDAYARGELSAPERRRFEQLFLSSPAEVERVQFARALSDLAAEAKPAGAATGPAHVVRPTLFTRLRARGASLSFALAAAVLAAAVFSWLLVERARMRDDLRRLEAERAALREGVQEMERQAAAGREQGRELSARPEAERVPPREESGSTAENSARRNQPPDEGKGRGSRRAVVSFVLKPGLTRGGGAATLPIPRSASSVTLSLRVEEEAYHSYRATIEDASGRRIWESDSALPRRGARAGAAVTLPPIPASTLPPGDYILLLSGKRPDGGLTGVAEYSFKVVRR